MCVYPNKLKNREFANAESSRFDSEKTSPLLFIEAVFSGSKMGFSALAKTDSLEPFAKLAAAICEVPAKGRAPISTKPIVVTMGEERSELY